MAGNSWNRQFYNFIWILLLFVTFFMSLLGRSMLVSVALEQEARCGQVEHVHTRECYWEEILACSQKAHVHDENCYILRLELLRGKHSHAHAARQ